MLMIGNDMLTPMTTAKGLGFCESKAAVIAGAIASSASDQAHALWLFADGMSTALSVLKKAPVVAWSCSTCMVS